MPDRSIMLRELISKNKKLVEFYQSYLPLEDSIFKMNNIVQLIRLDIDFPMEKALNTILEEANNMNKVCAMMSDNIQGVDGEDSLDLKSNSKVYFE